MSADLAENILGPSGRDPAAVADATERSLLDALLQIPDLAAEVRGIVGPGHFSNPVLGGLFTVILDMIESGEHEPGAPLNLALVLHHAEIRRATSEITTGLLNGLYCNHCVSPRGQAVQLARIVCRLARDRTIRRELSELVCQITRADGDLSHMAVSGALRIIESANADHSEAMTMVQLLEAHPEEPPPVVHSLFRRGEVVNIVGGSKSRKSWLAMQLAVCVASGHDFLGLAVEQGRVVHIDLELPPATLARRFAAVARALGVPPDALGDRLAILSLRGKPATVEALRPLLLATGPADLVILDPLFRTYGPGFNENDNAHMAAHYAILQALAGRCKAGVVVVHHWSKGLQADKRVTDVGAGAGSQSRAADVHIVLRGAQENPGSDGDTLSFEAVLRSFPPLARFGIRWAPPLWVRLPDEETPGRAWTPEGFVREIIAGRQQTRAEIVAEAGTRSIGVNLARRLFDAAKGAKLIRSFKDPKDGRRQLHTATDPAQVENQK